MGAGTATRRAARSRIANRKKSAGTAWSAGQFSRWGPPTGIARERETSTNNAGALASSPGGGLRPASRGSAIPAPTTLERWPVLPVGASDRHRAGARNQHQQRYPPPTSDRHRPKARNQHQQPRPPPTKPLSPCRRAAASARRWEPGTTCDANQEAGDPSFSRRRNG